MASFPRTIIPFEVSSLEMPGPLISKAQSGRVNIRSTQQIGRTWTEHYLINVRSVAGRGLLAAVDNFYRNGTIFTIDHRDHLTPMGTGGGSPLVNASPQLVTDPENFGAWSIFAGTPTLTAGQSDPYGGTAAYKLVDDDAASQESIRETVAFTGDGVKCYAVHLRRFDRNDVVVALRDNTAGAYVHRVTASFDAAGVLQTVVTLNGSGTIFPSLSVGSGWYRIMFNGTVIAANTNYVTLFGADGTNASTGGVYVFGANAWNTATPADYIGPSHLTATGSNLYIDGATASVSNWLRAGDLIGVGGLAPAYEVTADTSSLVSGLVILPINPPIFQGGAPADNAVVTITGVTMNACILEPPSYPSTSGIGADYGELICKFSESL